jgi:hypothetical protein
VLPCNLISEATGWYQKSKRRLLHVAAFLVVRTLKACEVPNAFRSRGRSIHARSCTVPLLAFTFRSCGFCFPLSFSCIPFYSTRSPEVVMATRHAPKHISSCHSCRALRIVCDLRTKNHSGDPCSNCKRRGRDCTIEVSSPMHHLNFVRILETNLHSFWESASKGSRQTWIKLDFDQ